MSFASLRARVKTTLEAVSKIGQVYDFLRHFTFWEEMRTEAKKDGRVNVWEITRLSAEQILQAPQGLTGVEPCFEDRHAIAIIGHVALDDKDESEKFFQDLIDRVIAAFRVDNTLGDQVLIPQQPQLVSVGHEMFSSVLTHACQINFLAIERVGG